jgi:hypothetical protein
LPEASLNQAGRFSGSRQDLGDVGVRRSSGKERFQFKRGWLMPGINILRVLTPGISSKQGDSHRKRRVRGDPWHNARFHELRLSTQGGAVLSAVSTALDRMSDGRLRRPNFGDYAVHVNGGRPRRMRLTLELRVRPILGSSPLRVVEVLNHKRRAQGPLRPAVEMLRPNAEAPVAFGSKIQRISIR